MHLEIAPLPLFDTHVKRIGKIIKVSLNNIVYWDILKPKRFSDLAQFQQYEN